MDYNDDGTFPINDTEEEVLDFNSDTFPGGIEDDFDELADEDEPLNIGTKFEEEEAAEELEI